MADKISTNKNNSSNGNTINKPNKSSRTSVSHGDTLTHSAVHKPVPGKGRKDK